jgi:hypothetical protein
MAKEDRLIISEESFQRAVVDLAHIFKYKVAYFRKARKKDGDWVTPVGADGKGWLDLVLVNENKHDLIFAELKSENGKMTKEQKDWFTRLGKCHESVYCWKPSDWENIVTRLSGK